MMMKFSDHLKSIRINSINEIANINVATLNIKKLSDKDSSLMWDLFTRNILNSKNNSLTLLNLSDVPEQDKEEVVGDFELPPTGTRQEKSQLDKEIARVTNIKKIADNLKKSFYEVKNGSAYFQSEETIFEDSLQCLFVVKNILYYLALLEDSDGYELLFDTIKNSKDLYEPPRFTKNSLMSDKSASSSLFNTISAIVKKEVPAWKNEVFFFSSAVEDSELGRIDSIREIIKQIGKCLLYCEDNKQSLENKEAYLIQTKKDIVNKFKGTFLKIKEMFMSLITNDTNKVGEGILDFLLFNAPKPNLENISYNYKEVNVDYSQKAKDLLGNFISRNRIYKIIIKQMFGEEVSIKNKNGKILFSLNKSRLDRMT